MTINYYERLNKLSEEAIYLPLTLFNVSLQLFLICFFDTNGPFFIVFGNCYCHKAGYKKDAFIVVILSK